MTPVKSQAKPVDNVGVVPANPAPAVKRHLLLLGAGHAHVQVLHGLAQHKLADVTVTLVAPHPRQLYSGMVPGFVAGHYTLADCMIPLDSLLARSGVIYVQGSATGVNAEARTVTLASGKTLTYDWLSLDTGPVMDREKIELQMPGAREHALFVRPIEAFGQLWPRVMAMAQQQKIRLVVVGAGPAGLELAMAAAHALRGAELAPGSRVTLLSGAQPPGASYPAGVQRRIACALQRLRIEVLAESCVGLHAGGMRLGNGQRLACDVPLLALGAQAPAWLAGSGLALDEGGFVAVNAYQQSTSHPAVFAAGDVASRIDKSHARSGVYAVRAGPPLLANLRAASQGKPLKPYAPQARTLNLLSCGGRHAIAVWGGLGVEGAWVWRWKNRIDREFVAHYAV